MYIGFDASNTSVITEELEVACIDRYIASFPKNERQGRFFRKLRATDNGRRLLGLKVIIGKNKVADFSKDVARAIGLPDPERFTSHSYKRTSLTFMGDSGLSISEIKAASGHKSDYVVQQYIEKSIIQKRKASSALGLESALGKESPASGGSPARRIKKGTILPAANFQHCVCSCDVCMRVSSGCHQTSLSSALPSSSSEPRSIVLNVNGNMNIAGGWGNSIMQQKAGGKEDNNFTKDDNADVAAMETFIIEETKKKTVDKEELNSLLGYNDEEDSSDHSETIYGRSVNDDGGISID